MLAEKLPRNFIIPELSIKALDLMYYSDMVISGGGTITGESALMNVPTVSIFTGQKLFAFFSWKGRTVSCSITRIPVRSMVLH